MTTPFSSMLFRLTVEYTYCFMTTITGVHRYGNLKGPGFQVTIDNKRMGISVTSGVVHCLKYLSEPLGHVSRYPRCHVNLRSVDTFLFLDLCEAC
jgi:hypothetical protein